MLLSLYVHLVTRLHRRRGEDGQTTAEYALVMLGAATVAILLAMWARDTGKLGRLLDTIVDTVIDLAE